MKIVIEARALSAKTSAGIKTYVRELTRALPMIAPQNEYYIFAENPPAWKHWWWLQHELPRRVRNANPDVVHFTKSAIPRRKTVPTVVTIHDVIPILFPESQHWLRRWYWPKTLAHAAQASDQILTVSETTKNDIVKYLNVPADKVTVTRLAVDTSRFLEHGTQRLSSQHPYVLFVGTRDQRKNVPLLIRAFARVAREIPHRLVIAGRSALKRDDAKAAAARLGIDAKIEWRDFVPDAELPALYAGADLFVWPSVYEGWGLPPMEAMASGVPVIVSDGGALPEVVGEAGEIVPFSESDLSKRTEDSEFEKLLAQRMVSVLGNKELHRRLQKAGLQRIQDFSWSEVARKTLAVYKKVCESDI